MEGDNPAFVLKEVHKVAYEQRPIPQIQDPYDVIVRVRWTGICGSDVHYWHEGRIGSFIVKEPMVLGHESSGTIHAVGDKVTSVQKGDNVAVEPGVPCRRCDFCKAGTYNLCTDMTFAATPPYDGTLCRYYRVPADFCYKLPASMSLEEGALMEPLTVAVHVCRQAPIKPGQSVVVYGAGPVGLLCLAVAKAFGAQRVVTVDVNEERLKFAKEYAATDAFRPSREDNAEQSAQRLIKELGLGDGADVAIDASGAEICMQSAVHVLKSGGIYVQGGMGKPDILWPIMEMVRKELTVRGSFRYGPDDYNMSIKLASSGSVDVKKLISKKVKFEEAEAAFKATKAAEGIKILIEGP